MVSAFPLHRYKFRDYLELEDSSPTKHEFLDGEIVAMAGGTPEHAALAVEAGRQLGNTLAGSRCRVFSSDLRVRALTTGLSTYPDLTVICGKVEVDPEGSTVATNPALVLEVTSDSTEDYDRGVKLEHYKTIPSLRTAVIVSHRERRVDVWSRVEGGPWLLASAGSGERASIAALDAAIDVDELYAATIEPPA